jgi:isoleucyl-tRNA synthetase
MATSRLSVGSIMFEPVEGSVDFPALEKRIGQFWNEEKKKKKSLRAREGAERFVFYEGPPTANGMPHPGHCLTRAIKDLYPRYRTMRGQFCERKAGWDTHGLPVEVEVCKELGIHSKEEIERYGVEPFIHKCQESVWRYMQEWQRLTERLGFWIHTEEAYVTYHQSYVESVWWALKTLFERDLLYRGHKIVWWWAQGGTALSSGEVGQGYREVADPSVYLRFPLVDDPETSLLVWTTTPWTLPSNQFVAVHPELEYAVVRDSKTGIKLILASDLVETIASKGQTEFEILSKCPGADLVGRRYLPPFDYYHRQDGDRMDLLCGGGHEAIGWRIVAADFVTTESGTGIVHQAPAFGEVDYEVLVAEQSRFADDGGPPLINAVDPAGRFTDAAPDYEGRWVKDADRDITRSLRDRGLLFHLEQYLHDYPFCWRAEEDPLIQYPRKSWFIRTTKFKAQMLENNHRIGWRPEHIREGRFGNFLESNVDWALSRERYWGTPLPIWVCDKTGNMEAIGNYRELLEKPGVGGIEVWEQAKQARPELPEDLKVHKPYIDAVEYDSPFDPAGRMQRVSEVIDCWFDSGAMPFAQWGYPQQGRENFQQQFPADFISEAIDQTRGWFYSLLAISTLLFDDQQGAGAAAPHELPHPFRNCIVLGLMLGEDGAKMSKSKRNYREPNEIFDKYGADALRWYFFANQPPWTPIRYNEQTIKKSIPEFLLRLWNVYSFFVIYSNIDGFDPAKDLSGDVGQLDAVHLAEATSYRPVTKRSELDRWILSELHQTIQDVTLAMDGYENYEACGHLTAFVDALSNWYVRRSRDRFWSGDTTSTDKTDAYWTLYECLLTTSKLVAPFIPFLAEAIWQNLAAPFGQRTVQSVHLCNYPQAKTALIDQSLSNQMGLIREIASLGRSARMNAKLKVRQPLSKMEVILAEQTHRDWLESHSELIRTELNVKQVEFTEDAARYITYHVQPDFKRLGPRIGRRMPALKKLLGQTDGGELLAALAADGKVRLEINNEPIELENEDVQVRLQAREGWAAAEGGHCVVVLSTELTEPLLREGLVRDLVRLVQDRRKELRCEFTDRIRLAIVTESRELVEAIDENQEYLKTETLSSELVCDPIESAEAITLQVGDHEFTLYIEVHR